MSFLDKLKETAYIEISSFQLLLVASIVSGILLFSYLLLLNLWQVLVGGGGFFGLQRFNLSADVTSAVLIILKHFLVMFLLFIILIFIKLHFRKKTHSLHQIATETASWTAVFNYVAALFYVFRYLNGDGGYGIMFGLFFSVILFPIFFLLVRFSILVCFRLSNSKTRLLTVFLLITGLFAFQFYRILITDISNSLNNDHMNHNVEMSFDARWNSDLERCLGSSDKNICLYDYGVSKYSVEACMRMYSHQIELTSREWFLKYSCYDLALSSLNKIDDKNNIFLCENNPDIRICIDNSLVNLSIYKAIKENDVDVCNQLGADGKRCTEVLNDYKLHSGFLNAVTYLFLK